MVIISLCSEFCEKVTIANAYRKTHAEPLYSFLKSRLSTRARRGKVFFRSSLAIFSGPKTTVSLKTSISETSKWPVVEFLPKKKKEEEKIGQNVRRHWEHKRSMRSSRAGLA